MKTTTGLVGLINQSLEVRCGGAAVEKQKTPQDANLANILIKMMRKIRSKILLTTFTKKLSDVM